MHSCKKRTKPVTISRPTAWTTSLFSHSRCSSHCTELSSLITRKDIFNLHYHDKRSLLRWLMNLNEKSKRKIRKGGYHMISGIFRKIYSVIKNFLIYYAKCHPLRDLHRCTVRCRQTRTIRYMRKKIFTIFFLARHRFSKFAISVSMLFWCYFLT